MPRALHFLRRLLSRLRSALRIPRSAFRYPEPKTDTYRWILRGGAKRRPVERREALPPNGREG